MTPADKEKLDAQARLHQMKINTRLTALQAAAGLMPMREKESERGCHLTLIAAAIDIEKYILGEIEDETKKAIEELNKPKPTIVPAKEIPASKFRP